MADHEVLTFQSEPGQRGVEVAVLHPRLPWGSCHGRLPLGHGMSLRRAGIDDLAMAILLEHVPSRRKLGV